MTPLRLVAGLCLALSVFAPLASAQSLLFSEYIEGSSNNKALEIYNAGSSPVSLSGVRIQMYFNGSSSAGLTLNLAGTLAPADVFVFAHSSADPVILAQADATSGAGFFNGDDAIVLRAADDSVLDSIGQIGFDPGSQWGSGLASTADNTLRRKSGICSGDTNPFDTFDPSAEWDGFDQNTFDGIGSHDCDGGGGPDPDPEPEPVVAAEIYEIQGAGMSSPLVGQKIRTTSNVVTAIAPNGFFIQTPDYRADASAETSNGVLVFTGSAPVVTVGDLVDVEGTVAEYFEMTEITSPVVTVQGASQPLPAAISFDETTPSSSATRPANEMERFEGMRIYVATATAAEATNQYGETSVVAGPVRPFREPGILYPGLPGLPVWDGNPEIFEIDAEGLGLPALTVGGGETITDIDGVLAYSFGNYQVWPASFSYSGSGPSTRPVRPRTPGELTVGAQNLFRLFDDRNDPALSEPVIATATYQARLGKISRWVRNVLGAPDILAVSEVEGLPALQDLAHRINADEAGLDYTAWLMEGNDVGGIDVGFLVRGSVVVDAVWQHGADEVFEYDGALLNDRPPLVLEARYTANGADFPVVVVAAHQRSLLGIEGTDRVRQKRLAQAESLAGLVQQIQTSSPDARVVVAGDFNAFEFTDGFVDVLGVVSGNLDPAGALLEGTDLVSPDLSNQVLSIDASDRYSYVHEGNAQVIDHVLTSSGLDPYVRGASFARGNADAPESLGNDQESDLRASDHDGLVIYLMTDFDADGLPDDEDGCANGDARPTVIIDGCDSGVPNPVSEDGCSLSDQIGALRDAAANHGAFTSALAKMLNGHVKDGSLTGAQKGAVQSCAAASN